MTKISKMLRMNLSRSNSHNNISSIITAAVQEVVEHNNNDKSSKTTTMMKRNSVPRNKQSSSLKGTSSKSRRNGKNNNDKLCDSTDETVTDSTSTDSLCMSNSSSCSSSPRDSSCYIRMKNNNQSDSLLDDKQLLGAFDKLLSSDVASDYVHEEQHHCNNNNNNNNNNSNNKTNMNLESPLFRLNTRRQKLLEKAKKEYSSCRFNNKNKKNDNNNNKEMKNMNDIPTEKCNTKKEEKKSTVSVKRGKKVVKFNETIEFYTYKVDKKDIEKYCAMIWWTENDTQRARNKQLDMIDQEKYSKNNNSGFRKSALNYVQNIMNGKIELRNKVNDKTNNECHTISQELLLPIMDGLNYGYHGILDEYMKDHVKDYIAIVLQTYQTCRNTNLEYNVSCQMIKSKSISISKSDSIFASIIGKICELQQQ